MAECGNKEWVMKKGTHYKIEGFVALYIFFLLMICLFVYTIFFSFFVHFYFMHKFSEVVLHFGLLLIFSQTVTEFEE